ncbi:MaoC family dehydratase [Paraburkholderia sp. GAS334]|uniref:MaoC family dehydratase n=1 Tax=Paraburkholderia sp. GAS334 TaxID=3035131 RepID=UPI003D1CED76
MGKERNGNYFEDFQVGAKITHATPRTLTEGDQSLYVGLTGSRAALHTADTNARQLGFERRPLEDLLVFNVAFGKTVPDISLNAIANLGYSDVRFVAPVYPGDTLAVESEVIGLKENSSRQSGVVYVRSIATNQYGIEVLTWIRWVMIRKRDGGADCPEKFVPSLDPWVLADRLEWGAYTADVQKICSTTGVNDLWDDYAVGERIVHPGAMTINNSDHSIATRLYQNTAKAHFDGFSAAAAGGQRLVYGGHVISICKALAYDGIENGLSILAINAGSHVNPTYASDTIACATEVIDKFDFNSNYVGGLRLRTVGVKNARPESIEFPESKLGKVSYPGNVVLDLDYTIAIPKRM